MQNFCRGRVVFGSSDSIILFVQENLCHFSHCVENRNEDFSVPKKKKKNETQRVIMQNALGVVILVIRVKLSTLKYFLTRITRITNEKPSREYPRPVVFITSLRQFQFFTAVFAIPKANTSACIISLNQMLHLP